MSSVPRKRFSILLMSSSLNPLLLYADFREYTESRSDGPSQTQLSGSVHVDSSSLYGARMKFPSHESKDFLSKY
jgi:hypothetical protein